VPVGVGALGLVLYAVFHPGLRSARDAALESQDAAAIAGDDVVDLTARRQQQEHTGT
jgi:hypothetical protein